MGIRYEHQVIVNTTPERAFAAIDDLALTQKWLPPCVSLTKIGDGPNGPGDHLLYVYRQGSSESQMKGEIIARIPNKQLHCKYVDSMFEVSVDLRVSATAEGTMTTHMIEITPKKLIAKIISPLIRLGLKKQTQDAARNLKTLLESSPV
jgi:carbon monoxide dehydrogenase subunit G